LALLPLVFVLVLAAALGWSYRFWFPEGVPKNDTTDTIDNQSYNKVGLQLVYSFLKGVGLLLVALILIWIGSLMA
jgi:hypothetical protein